MMDSQTKTTKPSGSSRADATQAFREVAENGSAQVKAAFANASTAAADAATLMKDSYSRTIKGAQEYNTKVIEFAQANTKAAFDFAQELVGVKIALRVFRIIDQSFTQAVRKADRANQGARNTGSKSYPCDRGAHQGGRHQGI